MKLFAIQLGNELRKLLARPRTWLGFAAVVVMLGAMVVVLRRIEPQRWPGDGEGRSAVRIGFDLVRWTSLIAGTLAVGLVAGDVMAKEVEEGTARMILCRAVARRRIVELKYLTCVIHALVLTFFMGATALTAGILRDDWGGLFATSIGLGRYWLAMVFLSLSLTSVASLGFLFSCLRMKPASATVATVAVVFVDSALRQIPFFGGLSPLFWTTHLSGWERIFTAEIPWKQVGQDYAYLLEVDAICFLAALLVFGGREFKT